MGRFLAAQLLFLLCALPWISAQFAPYARFETVAYQTITIIDRVERRDDLYMNQQCIDDLRLFVGELENSTDWAVMMADAYGFPDPGVVFGDTVWEGRYRVCREADRSELYPTTVGTHHCLVTWAGLAINDGLGICMPRSCNETDLTQYLTTGARFGTLLAPEFFPAFDQGLRPLRINCIVPVSERDLGEDPSAIAAIVILSTILFIVVLATFVHEIRRRIQANTLLPGSHLNGTVVSNGHAGHNNKAFDGDHEAGKVRQAKSKPEQEKQPNILMRLLLCFSILDHVPKMVSFKHPKGSMRCLNGIRSLTFLWILMGHTWQLGTWITAPFVPTVMNKVEFFPGGPFAGTVNMMEISVETFFVMSGMLTTISLLSKLSKEKKIKAMTMFKYYFHRFWRLTPVYMMVLMFYACLFHYLGDGPFYWPEIPDADNCRKIWWRHLLYINNIFNSADDDCMGWSWYLANDFQFYVIAPLFIFLIFFFPVVGILLTIGGLCGSLVSRFVITGQVNAGEADAYWDRYVTPWSRSSTYFIGVLLGYIIWKLKTKTKKLHWLVIILGWILSMGLVWMNVYFTTFVATSGVGNQFWETFRRPAFGVGVGWIIYACISGYGGFVNSIMSWPGWLPIAKLSYVGYLVHPIVIYHYYYRNPVQHWMDTWAQIYLTFGNAMVTLILSFAFSLFIEVPSGAIEKIIFGETKKPSNPPPELKTVTEVVNQAYVTTDIPTVTDAVKPANGSIQGNGSVVPKADATYEDINLTTSSEQTPANVYDNNTIDAVKL